MGSENITGLYAAICALLLVAFAVRVTLTRGKQKVLLGDGGKDVMLRAIRLHANAVEYVPLTLILMLLLEMHGAAHWFLHAAGITLVVARLLHAQGLMQAGGGLPPGRVAGAGLNWLLIVVLAVDMFFGFA